MANALKKLASGTLADSSGTLYTATAVQAIVKSITLCNKTDTAATATITFDSVNVINTHSIAAYDSLVIQMTHIIESGDIIAGEAGTASAIDYYISGVEVS
jgi:hypothetical protein